MSDDHPLTESVPKWLLAIGPVLIIGIVAIGLYLTWPFSDLDGISEASTLEILWLLTVVGAVAGIIPVTIGMLWFPYLRRLDVRVIHGFVALGAGVLAFIAFEMTEDMFEYAGEVEGLSVTVGAGVGIAVVGVTFGLMYVLSNWRESMTARSEKSGLQIAYLVAFALGLHSIGEGLAIGVSLINEQATMVMLLVIGFVIHNVLEGLTCIAAMARDQVPPRLIHFGAIAALAGGPVILGGWIGSFGETPLLALVFFAVAVGAILQAIVEMVGLVRLDTDTPITRVTASTFVAGFFLMFLLEDVIVGGYIVP
ncbi:ZIP family metal transporter [Natronobiforma cellulositropha]|uniref:ZIP family metal transporter n=1 Tax=Natronobiforma cellulositropha TaxID=1679076 RepID=UPI0021D5DED2|nr:metal cation transporter [Natronobiforma cellulositropha]